MRPQFRYNGPALPRGYAIGRYNPRAGAPLATDVNLINPYYRVYATTETGNYLPYGGKRAHAQMEVLSTTLADYDGQSFILGAPTEGGGLFSKTFLFDDDTVPPSTTTSINISGLATEAAILAQIVLAIGLQVDAQGRPYWLTEAVDASTINIYQRVPGYLGNQPISVSTPLTTCLRVNDVLDFAVGAPRFYGGQDLNIPAIVGPRRGFMWGPVNNVQSYVVA